MERKSELIVLGEQILQKDLHLDPMVSQRLHLNLEKETLAHREKFQAQQKTREQLRKEVVEHTDSRVKYVLGDKATAENTSYVTEPMLQLIDQQSKMLEDSRAEIERLQIQLKWKELDIAKLTEENNKFLQLKREDSNWIDYEALLAKERIVNRRLIDLLADRQRDKLLEEGKKNTYSEWISQKAQYGSGKAPLFPFRRFPPHY